MRVQKRLHVTEYFRARLAEEVRRCERYGHRFAVVFASCRHADPHDIFNNLRPLLRSTDIVEIIRANPPTPSPNGRPEAANAAAGNSHTLRDRVAMILLETDRKAAEVTLRRLRTHCVNLQDLSLGLAVYPEDSMNPMELLAKAAEAAGEGPRP